MQTIELKLCNSISMSRLRSDYYVNDGYRTDYSHQPYLNDSYAVESITSAHQTSSSSSVNPKYRTITDAIEMSDNVFTETTDNDYSDNKWELNMSFYFVLFLARLQQAATMCVYVDLFNQHWIVVLRCKIYDIFNSQFFYWICVCVFVTNTTPANATVFPYNWDVKLDR